MSFFLRALTWTTLVAPPENKWVCFCPCCDTFFVFKNKFMELVLLTFLFCCNNHDAKQKSDKHKNSNNNGKQDPRKTTCLNRRSMWLTKTFHTMDRDSTSGLFLAILLGFTRRCT